MTALLESELREDFAARTQRSRQAHERACEGLPGGVNRAILFQAPHPLFIASADGAYVEDLDGNRYLDLLGNYTAMILGHRHPAILAAVEKQLERGLAWAGASELEYELAATIGSRLPSCEQTCFTSSGTEAAMMAVRAARAHTGRPLVLKFEGGYHGTYDLLTVSTTVPSASTEPWGDSLGYAPPGVPTEIRELVRVVPFNDLAAAERVFAETGEQIAAVIVEPVLGVGGLVVPSQDFLAGLRELTLAHRATLIFDEVISFRVSPDGAQGHFGVTPDLTVLGKIIGGGFAVGAVGGSGDLMRIFHPADGSVTLSGTFHAHPVSLAAGIATLTELTPDALDRLNATGQQIRARMQGLFDRCSRRAMVTGIASLFNIHISDEPVVDYRSAARGDVESRRLLHLALLNEGILIAPRGLGCLSTVVDDRDCEFFLGALERALNQLDML